LTRITERGKKGGTVLKEAGDVTMGRGRGEGDGETFGSWGVKKGSALKERVTELYGQGKEKSATRCETMTWKK